MTRGRKPLPAAVHQLRGSYRADRHGPTSPIESEEMDAPSWLTDKAREHWPAVASMLHERGLSAPGYTVAIALLVDAVADYAALAKEAATAEPVLVNESGKSYINPVYTLKAQSWDRLLRALTEFGLTPSAARGVPASKPPGPDPLDQFLLTRDRHPAEPPQGLDAFKLGRPADPA
ncbi:MAG: phage terminase small subunit P27 family [Planctomycetota bacterium]|nr:phage terminase small subunit P27 family [Planctomycetota bacterium]